MAKLAASAHPELKSQIDALTGDPSGAPGVVFAAVNKNGEVIFEHASGKVGAGRSEDMTLDSVFWIASCTKMITGIAAMQLVEQGKLALDDVELVEKLAPVSPFLYSSLLFVENSGFRFPPPFSRAFCDLVLFVRFMCFFLASLASLCVLFLGKKAWLPDGEGRARNHQFQIKY